MSSGRGGSAPSPSFALHAARPRVLLIGEDAGIGPVISLAERLRGELASADYGRGSPPAAGSTSAGPRWKPLVLLGSEQPFPFRARPSAVIVAGIPREVIGCMPLRRSGEFLVVWQVDPTSRGALRERYQSSRL